ncbi:TPA: hypothetical protein ACGO6M_000940 [Streptococcus suis]
MSEHFEPDRLLTYILCVGIALIIKLIYDRLKDSLFLHLELDEQWHSAGIFKKIACVLVLSFTRLNAHFKVSSFKEYDKKLFNDTVSYYVDFLEWMTGTETDLAYLRGQHVPRISPQNIYSTILENILYKKPLPHYQEDEFHNSKYEKFLIPQNNRFSTLPIKCLGVLVFMIVVYLLYEVFIKK